jgi:hypothetical protein
MDSGCTVWEVEGGEAMVVGVCVHVSIVSCAIWVWYGIG